ncbi:hypothetical protein Riv7116_0461 [Rivularia sp. PCC 7116]|nr:hypothetical protein Riv7116_0461 [Rivularia sp. PCC 7116]
MKSFLEKKYGIGELKYEFIFIIFTSPLNPPISGDLKLFFSPRIGGWGANHTFNQQRQKYEVKKLD